MLWSEVWSIVQIAGAITVCMCALFISAGLICVAATWSSQFIKRLFFSRDKE